MRGAKMVLDVVQCAPSSPIAPQLRKVLQFVCGNALVCDTIKDARSVAFDGPERLKVRLVSAGDGHIEPPPPPYTKWQVVSLC